MKIQSYFLIGLLVLGAFVSGCGREDDAKLSNELTGVWQSSCLLLTTGQSRKDNWEFDGASSTLTQQFWLSTANGTCAGTHDSETTKVYSVSVSGDNPNGVGVKNITFTRSTSCGATGCVALSSPVYLLGVYKINNETNVLQMRTNGNGSHTEVNENTETNRQNLLDEFALNYTRITDQNDKTAGN